VLVVDDDIDAADLMAEMLRSKGFVVVVAHASSAALDVVRTFVPEVALLDIGLPEMDGYELARQISEAGVACQLIAITGYGQDEDRARSLYAGFAAHLVKPVSPEAILSAIDRGAGP
jgi:CheY-like chemotaxis protein